MEDSSRVERLKAELFARLLQEEGVGGGDQRPPLTRANVTNPPLSFTQERLWFLEQLGGIGSAYNIPAAVRVTGKLEVPVLERAFREITRRHEVLRTTFAVVNEQPVQVISASMAFNIEVVDLSERPDRAGQAFRVAEQEISRPFDLQTGPLFRVKLVKLEPEEHLLLFTIHHIIADAWSRAVLLAELGTLYRAYREGKPAPLPELKVQYGDYAVWSRRWLAGPNLQNLLEYWRNKLKDAPAILQLPTDYPRPAVRTYRGARLEVEIPAGLTVALNHLSKREGATLFMTLLAAFYALLYRYSGQEDIVVGSPIANRTSLETEALVGFFVNTLALRGDLSGNPAFNTLLARVREMALEAYAHQEMPFEKLVEELQPERSLGHQPLFQVMFVLQNAPVTRIEQPGLTFEPITIDTTTAKFDLLLDLTETENGLKGYLEYSTDLFEKATVARWMGHFEELLSGITENPTCPVGNLPLVSPAELNRYIRDFNRTEAEYPEKCLHHLISEQAARTPDAPALTFNGRDTTCAELEEQSNRLANFLVDRGVGPEVVVGLCMERSPEMVISLLGILKAGGAYLPLDPAYPRERLEIMLEDSGARLIITRQQWRALLPETNVTVLDLDSVWQEVLSGPATAPEPDITPDNLAYVVFTSGSTGRPKGIVTQHRGSVSHLAYARRAFEISRQDVVLQLASLVSDASVEDLFGSLMDGCRVVLVPSADAKDPAELVKLIERENITAMLATTPRLLGQLVEAGKVLNYRKRTLRLIFVNGEALYYQECAAVREVFGEQVVVVNQYGPTECSITSSDYPVKSGNPGEGMVPLGHPVANTSFYLLDGKLEPVPPGVAGEIFIGGICVARGYSGRPDLTAEKFLPDPFSKQAGARMYRTGDLARFRDGETLEYLGRADHQVKIRGYRVEPGEVEAALSSHPGVQIAVVNMREDTPGDRRLVAYLVPAEPAPGLEEIRAHLKKLLPEYMVPSAYVFLEAFPLTPNGKVNRKALPRPEQERPALSREYAGPRTPLEESICALWSEGLQLDRVGVYDNFFDLGGHSLLAMQLCTRLSAQTGREVPVRYLFLHPTVSELALALETAGGPTGKQAARTPVGESPDRAWLEITGEPLPGAEKITAAALSALPSELVEITGLSREQIRQEWCRHRPVMSALFKGETGLIGLVTLPVFDSELYLDPARTCKIVEEGLALAGQAGAQVVSLTGLIPSATAYGKAFGNTAPAITTGHATTAATVVLSLQRALELAGRKLEREKLGVLGLGSIGLSSLRLLLDSGPHPAEILLCDLYSKRERLAEIRQELAEKWKYRGPVSLVVSPGKVPEDFYRATLALGSSNVPAILEVERLLPGTVLVDDSAPYCFSLPQAIQRAEESADILFTEAGTLESPEPFYHRRYVTPEIEKALGESFRLAQQEFKARHITGCVFSGLLSALHPELNKTIGEVRPEDSRAHLDWLVENGYRGAAPHSGGYIFEDRQLEYFRARYGHR
jgi:pristinamycin I synthase-3/4